MCDLRTTMCVIMQPAQQFVVNWYGLKTWKNVIINIREEYCNGQGIMSKTVLKDTAWPVKWASNIERIKQSYIPKLYVEYYIKMF